VSYLSQVFIEIMILEQAHIVAIVLYTFCQIKKGLFAGKVALVTGGATGIGKAISNELLSLGELSIRRVF